MFPIKYAHCFLVFCFDCIIVLGVFTLIICSYSSGFFFHWRVSEVTIWVKLTGSWVGVTKAPSINSSVSQIFYLTKVPVRFFVSHSYLAGVPTAQLWWHLSNINMIFNSIRVLKNEENNGTEETDLTRKLERLCSADTPGHPMITHTNDSYWIPSQNKTKSKLQI